MARKRQHKNARKAAKQQRSPARARWVAPHPPQTRPAIKISEAILTLAEPLRAHYREPHRIQAIIALAVIAWNISLFPDEEHAHVQGMLLESLPTQLSGEELRAAAGCLTPLRVGNPVCNRPPPACPRRPSRGRPPRAPLRRYFHPS